MIVTQSAHEQAEGETKAAALLAVMFYFGRVDSVTSAKELERELAAVDLELRGKPIGPLLEQCGKFMGQRGKELQNIADRVEEREEAARIN